MGEELVEAIKKFKGDTSPSFFGPSHLYILSCHDGLSERGPWEGSKKDSRRKEEKKLEKKESLEGAMKRLVIGCDTSNRLAVSHLKREGSRENLDW